MSPKTIQPPPKPIRDPRSSLVNGVERTDEYAWMRLTEEQRNAKTPDAATRRVIDHLTEENAYAEQVLAPVAGLRNALYAEMKGRIKESDLSVPYRENGFWYRYRYDEGA